MLMNTTEGKRRSLTLPNKKAKARKQERARKNLAIRRWKREQQIIRRAHNAAALKKKEKKEGKQ